MSEQTAVVDEEPIDVEVVDVDTSAPKPDTDPNQGEPVEVIDEGSVTHLPVKRDRVADGPVGTLVPVQEELRGIAQLALTLSAASTMPKALKDKPADVLAVMLTGRELGVAPMTAVRMFHVIDGTVTLAAKVRMAMVRERGLGRVYRHQAPRLVPCPRLREKRHGENCKLCAGDWVMKQLCPCGRDTDQGTEDDEDAATWHAERNDTPGVVFSSTYTKAMAGAVETTIWSGPPGNRKPETGSLLDKDNWKNYPARMLSWRSLGYLLDDAFSEVGTGLYQPDEIGAITDEDGLPVIDVESTEVLVPADTSPAAQSRARADAERRRKEAERAAGGGSAAKADQATLAKFAERIDGLRRYPGAVEDLQRLWQGERPSGENAPPLRPLKDLYLVECKQASALIDSVERRVAKGDYGEPTSPASEPSDGRESPESGSGGDGDVSRPPADEPSPAAAERVSVQQLGFDPSSLPSGSAVEDDLVWANAATEQLIAATADELADVGDEEIKQRLKAIDRSTSGTRDKVKARLAVWLIRRKMEILAADGGWIIHRDEAPLS